MAKTWYITDTNDTPAITGGVYTHALADAGSGADNLTAPSGPGSADAYYLHPSAVSLVGQSNTGTWTVTVNVSSSSANTAGRFQLHRANSGGTIQNSSGFLTFQTGNASGAGPTYFSGAATGTSTLSITNPSLGTWASGDRLVLQYQVFNQSAHGSASGPTLDNTLTNVSTPFTFGGGFSPVDPFGMEGIFGI